MIYRATYQREGKKVGVTFFAASDVAAADFTRAWEEHTQLPIESLKRQPPSPFRNSVYRRRKSA